VKLSDKTRVIVTFSSSALLASLIFFSLDQLPSLQEFWYFHGKYTWLIPRSRYHTIGGLFLAAGLAAGFLIVTNRKWIDLSILGSERRWRTLAIAVFALLPVTSFAVHAIAQIINFPYFFMAPLTLGITLSLSWFLPKWWQRNDVFWGMIGACLLIPIAGMFNRKLLGVSLLYPMSGVWLGAMYGYWLYLVQLKARSIRNEYSRSSSETVST
jgi:hypothetical protein